MEFERLEQFGHPVLQNEAGQSFELREDGLIKFGDVARGLLGQQCQYASRYIDPTFHNHSHPRLNYPNLALGLRVDAEDPHGNYHAFGIHPDDVDEFVARYKAFESYRMGYNTDEDGERRPIDEQEQKQLEDYLKEVGAIS